MGFLLELLFDIVLEGAFETVEKKIVPKWARILTAAALLLFYLSFFGLLLYAAIYSQNAVLIAAVVLVVLIVTIGLAVYIIKRKKN